MAFEPVMIDGDYYTDGGVAEVAPLKPAIHWGADEILVILTKDPFDDEGKPKYSNALEFGKAIIDTMSLDVLVNDIIHCHKVNEQVRRDERKDNKRVVDIKVFAPSEKMSGSLDFSAGLMRERIDLGEHDFAMMNLLDLDRLVETFDNIV
jgi:predicted patatin/cPLA2 family phospholipase